MKHILKKDKLLSPADGLEISILTCLPGTGPEKSGTKGIVQLVHGMCEHKERYIPFMEFLADNGYTSVIHDHRGHGESVRSSEDLGYFYEGGYTAMIDDIRAVTGMTEQELPGLPLILFGHSMGSMAVRSYAKRYDGKLSALVVCGSPSYNPGLNAGRMLAKAYGMMAGRKSRPTVIQALAFGAFNRKFKDEKSGNAWICSDPEIVKAYDADPKCNFRFTADGFLNLFSLMEDAYSIKGWTPRNPGMPILFISGEDDPCMVSPGKFRKAVDRMKQAGYRDVTAKTYHGMRHEILNETGKEEVWNDVLEFCENTILHPNPQS